MRSAAGADRQAVVAIKELLSRVKRSDSVTVMLFGNCGVKLSPSIRDPSRRVRFLAVISIFPNEPVVLSTALKTVPPWLTRISPFGAFKVMLPVLPVPKAPIRAL